MIERKNYLEKLENWKDEQVIKVITGIRRCGKSMLLKQFQNKLLSDGVAAEQIVYINFEDMDNEPLLDYQKLYEHIKSLLLPDKLNYIFLDEIQCIDKYEKVVDSLYIRENVDLYITGSNAYMLSSDLSTLLSGRFVEILMLPFSFAEFCQANPNGNEDKLFADYMQYGGLPYIATMDKIKVKVEDYIEGIYNTVIIKDVEDRQARRLDKKVIDTALLCSIAKYLADVSGNLVNISGIANYLTSNVRKVSSHTVDDYVELLTEAFIFYKVNRFDVKGKELLKTNAKYYIVDTGLKNYLVPRKNYDLGSTLENIAYLELLRRGYKVNVGKVASKEIDFVAERNGIIEYYQVCANLTDENTFNREISVFEDIKDNYQKTILTLDRFTLGNYNGIIVENIIDWLLGEMK